MGIFIKNITNLWLLWASKRQQLMALGLSYLYGKPVMVAPQHLVGLAGAAVLWGWQGNQRHLLMVRPKDSPDKRARFVSCLGLGKHPAMPQALLYTLKLQLGETFTKLLPHQNFTQNKVAAAPMLSMQDEDTGAQVPMQVLAWVAELRPNQMEALELFSKLELVMVAEDALESPLVSPTHRLLWQAVQAQLPKPKQAKMREDGVVLEEDPRLAEAVGQGRKLGRVLH